MTSDREFSVWLQGLPRELTQEQVDQKVAEHDAVRGPYCPHGSEVHHIQGEAAH